MATTTFTPSGLKGVDIGDATWDEADEDNWNNLSNNLLKLGAILDVSVTGRNDGDVLKYNSTSEDWEVTAPPYAPNATTTTTTTSTTTTTTTTTI